MDKTTLQRAIAHGRNAALRKFALAGPTPADNFAAEVDTGKDMPPPAPALDAPALPQDPAAALGDPTGAIPKAASLGLKDMLFFEKMMGANEAKSMFQGIEKSMTGQTRGVPQTLNITPGGVQRLPHPGLGLGAQAARAAVPPPPPAAAFKPRLG